MFTGAIVEGELTLWFQSKINVVSIVEDMNQSNIYVNYLSKYNRFIVDCQLDLLFTNHLWIRFKEICDSLLSHCMTRKEAEIGVWSNKYFR